MRLQEDKNAYLDFLNFFFGPYYPNINKYILGNKETISSITEQTLSKYKKELFVSPNCALCIYNSTKLNNQQKTKIESLLCQIPNGDYYEYSIKNVSNQFKFKAFFDDSSKNVHISWHKLFDYYEMYIKPRSSALLELLVSLVFNVSRIHLRENKNIAYKSGIYANQRYLTHFDVYYEVEVDFNNLKVALEEIYKLFSEYILEFIKSKEYKSWLNAKKSETIYILNQNINTDVSSKMTNSLFLYNKIFKYTTSDYFKAIRSITTEELIEYINKWLAVPGVFYFISNSDSKLVEDVFVKSKIYQILSTGQVIRI